ncbi:MAG: response regulator [Oscillibacter sp.]|nr:response regulator [Oscillibacter sp.]
MLRVFIAEDEPIVLLGFKKMVAASGHTVVGTAADGTVAVEQVLQLKPDVILMDINLPGMDGISAIEKIHQTLNVPAVVITGFRDETIAKRAGAAGVFGYLQKPVDEYEIRSVLQIAVERHKDYTKVEKERDQAVTRLDERKLVERAKGILMEDFGLSEPEAMRALQKKSKDTNKKLAAIAVEIIKKSELLK